MISLLNKSAPHVVQIIEQLKSAGFVTYLVGGAVRDIMLGRTPKDYDLSGAATPEEVKALFGRRKSRIIGKRFKIAHLYHGREIIEISTFRKTPAARNPEELEDMPPDELIIRRDNEYGTAVEDAWRRDFTVNAIFFDPLTNKVIDYTGMGKKDLEDGLVRAIGDPKVRFAEDPVRMLRALKLVGQYGFRLEENTEKALRDSLPLIDLASRSRLVLELEKIMRNPYSTNIFRAFHAHGFLERFLPNVAAQWDSLACQRAMELLHEHNLRTLTGDSPDFLSDGVAALSLPFFDAAVSGGKPSGCEWEYYSGIENDIRDMIYRVIHPHNLPKFLIAASIGAILLQPRLKGKGRPQKTRNHPNFRAARELMVTQNNIWWKDPALEAYWHAKPTALEQEQEQEREREQGPEQEQGQAFDAASAGRNRRRRRGRRRPPNQNGNSSQPL